MKNLLAYIISFLSLLNSLQLCGALLSSTGNQKRPLSEDKKIQWHEAIKRDDDKKVEEMLALYQIDLNLVDSNKQQKNNALHLAVMHHSHKAARVFIKKGADTNKRNYKGETSLLMAVSNIPKGRASYKVINSLLIPAWIRLKKLSVNEINLDVISVIINYCDFSAWNLDTVALLLDKGAIIKQSSRFIPLLHLAVEKDNLELAKMLLDKRAPVNERGKDEKTSLHLARSEKMTRLLLRKGADLRKKDKWGYAPIHTAADLHLKGVLKALLEKGANVNRLAEYKYTPLHYAARRNIAEVPRFLIEHGADINAKNHIGDTPLHLSMGFYVEPARVLIKAGANPNIKDFRGRTPLHIAVEIYTSIEIIKLLLKAGANPNIRDNEGGWILGNTPLDTFKKKYKDQSLLRGKYYKDVVTLLTKEQSYCLMM